MRPAKSESGARWPRGAPGAERRFTERERYPGETALLDLDTAADDAAARTIMARFVVLRAIAVRASGVEEEDLEIEAAAAAVYLDAMHVTADATALRRLLAWEDDVPELVLAFHAVAAAAGEDGQDAVAFAYRRTAFLLALAAGDHINALRTARFIRHTAMVAGASAAAERWQRRADAVQAAADNTL